MEGEGEGVGGEEVEGEEVEEEEAEVEVEEEADGRGDACDGCGSAHLRCMACMCAFDSASSSLILWAALLVQLAHAAKPRVQEGGEGGD